MARLALIPILVLLANSAAADIYSAERLLSACRGVYEPLSTPEGPLTVIEQNFGSGYCWGVFAALQAVHEARPDSTPPKPFGVCLPEDSSRVDLVSVFSRYAEARPGRLREDFFSVVQDALQEAFPCEAD